MKNREKIFLIAVDFVLVLFSLFMGVFIRFEGELSPRYIYHFEWLFLVIALMCIASYYFFGLYEKLWRYAGIQELKNIFWANLLAFTPIAFITVASGGRLYSRSIIIIAAMLSFFFTGGIRFFLRMINERVSPACAGGKKVIIVGANDAGEAVLRELMREKMGAYCPVGFIDEDKSKLNIRIHNIPVLGNLESLPSLVQEMGIEETIIALPSPSLIHQVIGQCRSLKVEFKVVPHLSEIINGRISVSKLRNVQIEDLLERDEVVLDVEPVKSLLSGKTILVTGAGGSIGSEICRQIVHHPVKKLILLGRGENSIYEIALELKNLSDVPLVQFIGDVRDAARMEAMMRLHKPQVVFHTAAHKHVPMMEANAAEAAANNVLGTRNIMLLCEKHGAESFTLLSTDKAVNPGSVMGATKRLSEMFMKSYTSVPRQCRFAAVRFGNVLDSRGSVVPTFRRQIAMGGPVTVTSADMTRFFMTIPEAVHLVLQASALGQAGEIFILDMGRPVKIIDLARNLILLSGFQPEKDIPIQILGTRPGEKLEEQLVNEGETTEPTRVSKIQRVITGTPAIEEMEESLARLKELVDRGSDEEVKDFLVKTVPGYEPA
jgi:FlaA1/EpsC-like NDP-sugar epimerase